MKDAKKNEEIARKKRRDIDGRILAYKMAEKIADFAEDYDEAIEIANIIKQEFESQIRKNKPVLRGYPVDSWGCRIGAENK